MKLPQIRLQSQMAKIEMNTINGTQSIEQPKAVQTIEQPSAEVTMKRTPSKLTIDQSQAWRDMGLFTPIESGYENARLGKAGVQEGTSRRAIQGDQLMRIENGGNPIVDQAITNGYRPEKTLGIRWVPSSFAVKTSYEASKLHIEVNKNKPIVNVQPQKPIVDFSPGKVETSMKQYAEIEIDYAHVNWKR
ncbi:hypothetical protein HNQ94_002076 [Salirhabdus euzebyi]|uniref:Uncharacterized protein n=1 Tax=Salirhabdus euzebyi TaxID=394506 RepID=A0A841Q5J5_9BACI|nr:DUF6470 family protein [Salirhabdus euzebyi]MBB6453627.1 hypothetical protein [Salirhabdus euzebyi]